MAKSEPQVPLTPAVFHILLALFGQERHGYDIMQQVKTDSQGAVKMGPGTLYGSLDRMITADLVAKSDTRDPAGRGSSAPTSRPSLPHRLGILLDRVGPPESGIQQAVS